MGERAKGGTRLGELVRMAMPLCKQLEVEQPRMHNRRPAMRSNPKNSGDIPNDISTSPSLALLFLPRGRAGKGHFSLLELCRRLAQEGRDMHVAAIDIDPSAAARNQVCCLRYQQMD